MVTCYDGYPRLSSFDGCSSSYYPDGACCTRYYSSAWSSWARWVLAGGIVLFFLIVFALLCCVHSRRRRRRGATPMYGSGWMSNGQKFQSQQHQGHQQNYGQPPPPQYSAGQGPQYTGSTFQPSDGYYGQGAQYQPQPPQNAYHGSGQRGAELEYSPPAGPPPGK